MFETIKNCFKVKEIRKKIFITLLLLLVFRIGCYIPVPGIDSDTFSEAISNYSFLELMSSITGSSLANATLFALGISPYINASIIIQLLTVGIPALERLSRQGEEGRKKIAQITRYVTIALAIAQAIGIIVNIAINSEESALNLVMFGGGESGLMSETAATWLAGIFLVVVYTAGAMLVMFIGERITEYGVGNGISLVIFVGIISTAGITIVGKFEELFNGDLNALWILIGFFILTILEFTAIVAVDLSERRIPVQYAKQVKGRKMYGGQCTVIPIRIAGGGVMPLIFAFALISFPAMLASLFWPGSGFEQGVTQWFSGSSPYWYGQLIYMVVLCLLIFAFAFFYSSMQFNPEDVSKTIQQNGGFIQGIRPGKPTADYLKKISNRITLFGAIYLSLVAFIPSIISMIVVSLNIADTSLLSVFSTTGILIVVSVALELDKQLQSQLMMKNYKGFLK
ncbi:MAG TPA: preprotein translocase subunit SecY [Candidatus Coproplasma excrementavium]|nr:preprotein translocase subunit SecY [Candidatus Coproplasma excrementavium]